MANSLKAEDLIKELFESTLLDSGQFDQDIVGILKTHLTAESIASKAGENNFKEFRALFVCQECGKKLSYKSGEDKNPYCKKCGQWP